MKPSLLESIFGPNWRTSVSGIATTVSGIVLVLVALPATVWQDPKVWIPLTAGVIAKTIRDLSAKDAKVSGNNTEDAPTRVAQADGTSKTLPPPTVVTALAILLLPALLLQGCASANSALQQFNAAAGPRLEQDVQAAIGGASGAVAAQLAASLQGTGTIDPSVLGSAAGVGALTALVKLDIARASGTAEAAAPGTRGGRWFAGEKERARLNTWLVAIHKHRVRPENSLAWRKLHAPLPTTEYQPLRELYVGADETHPLVVRP